LRIFLIRHADPDYVNDHLTETGHREAAALGKRMAATGLDELYVSPLGRAQVTAGYISQQTGVPIRTERWTCELDWPGITLNGERKAIWDFPGESLPEISGGRRMWDDTSDHWLKQEDYGWRFDELRMASDVFLLRHNFRRENGLYRIEGPSPKNVAVVCHGGFGLAWLAHLLQLPLSLAFTSFWIAPSSVTTILFEQRSEQYAVPRCIGLSDISHLYANGMTCQPRGLIGNID